MKKAAKSLIASVLGWQVRRLRKRHDFKVIAVTGSIGKTSSKLAIASVLSKAFSVRYQSGNYNDKVSVPLIFFGENMPNIFNPLQWFMIFLRNELKIRKRFPYDIVIAEVGTDGPGQIAEFSKYLSAELAVVTAITPEHMEYFDDLDAVAGEEFQVAKFSKKLLVNADLVAEQYRQLHSDKTSTYGLKSKAEIKLDDVRFKGDEASFTIMRSGKKIVAASHSRITEPQLYSVCAAAAVGLELDMEPELISEGINSIPPVNGRMQHLEGLKGSTIIDDSYNSSPEATRAALDTLYRMESPHKIAVLGNMNELGKFSADEHTAIGSYCKPEELELVVTIGPDANRYLAPEAEAKGCKVARFEDPYSAGKHLAPLLKKDTILLVKGSQNKVFAEETVKLLLKNPQDSVKLVRQTPYWLKIKAKSFKK